ncbi:dienelactone hydrolase family protein [Parasediminibacterium sp. JCM 36343]|uniref:dienelactone hydrolase family protein n=1 Tax=Parasediminibacterium sp. JCM 36343 TaxID=3374279 RepID=UPI00397A09BF
MKKLLLLFVAALCSAALLSYTFKPKEHAFLSPDGYIACYNHAVKDQIQLDAASPDFVKLHANPLYYTLENPTGSMVSFASADGKAAQGYYIKPKKKSNKWLFVIQEWWGLNDNIKREAETFAKEFADANILALDMYDGKVATTPDSAGLYMKSAKSERLESIVKAGIAYAGPKAKIYTLGWCFGGGWSLQSTLLAGKQAAGCVMYYGRPETDVERLKTLNCDVIGFFGNKDKGIAPAMVDAFEKNMKEASKQLTIYRYDAAHGFANPSNPVYDKAATEDAHTKAVAFLKAHKL